MVQTDYQPTERRPIAARELGFSQRGAQWLAAHGISPNLISVSGVVFSALAGAAFWSTNHWPQTARLAWIAGAALVQLRLLANMWDGMVAVATGRASRLGELFNEVPDRLSDTFTLIGLGYAWGGYPMLGYLAALAAVFTAYVRAVAKVAGCPQDYCAPMAKQQRMFTVTLVAIYLGLTPAAWQPYCAACRFGLSGWALCLIFLGTLLTAGRRLIRAGRYLGESA